MKKIVHFSLVTVLAMLLAGCTKNQPSTFPVPLEDALQTMLDGKFLLSPEEFNSLTRSAADGLLLVDLRSPALFDKGHLTDAINIPDNRILDDEQFAMLQGGKQIVLYGDDVFQASGPCLLLSQLGLENVKMLGAGYADFVAGGTVATPETARYDYPVIFQKAIERHAKEVEAGKAKPVVVTRPAEQKKVIVPQPKPKKQEAEEEGC